MSGSLENFFICNKLQADLRAFSLNGAMPVCNDFIALKTPECRHEWYFTLPGSFQGSALEFLTDKLFDLTISVTDSLLGSVKRIVRRVKQCFDRSWDNFRRRSCRLMTPPIMALRL